MLGLNGSSHNIVVGMNVLIWERIMEVSKKNINQDIFGIVASIKQHIVYRDQDEDKIKWQLNQLYADGNLKVTARVTKLNANDNKKKRKQDNQEDAEDANKDDPPIAELYYDHL